MYMWKLVMFLCKWGELWCDKIFLWTILCEYVCSKHSCVTDYEIKYFSYIICFRIVDFKGLFIEVHECYIPAPTFYDCFYDCEFAFGQWASSHNGVKCYWQLNAFTVSVTLHSLCDSLSQVMHGGLFSEDGVTLEDLRKIDRNRQPPDSGRVRHQMHQIKPFLKWKMGTFLCLCNFSLLRSYVWPPLVRSTASGLYTPTRFLFSMYQIILFRRFVRASQLLFWIYSFSLSCRMAALSVSEEWVVNLGQMSQNASWNRTSWTLSFAVMRSKLRATRSLTQGSASPCSQHPITGM